MNKIRIIKEEDFTIGDPVTIDIDHGPDEGWVTHRGIIAHIDKYNQSGLQIVVVYYDHRWHTQANYYYVFNDYSRHAPTKIK